MPLQYLLYVALAVFVIFNLARFIKIAKMPVHVRWELYPVPHEPPYKVKYGGSYMEETDWWKKPMHTNKIGELGVMLPEIFLLKGVWEHNRGLWFWSWLMHWAFYLAIGWVMIAILAMIVDVAGLSGSGVGIGGLLLLAATIISWLAVIIGLVGTIGVLMMRLFSKKMNTFVSMGTVFNLLFIIAFFGTGLYAQAVSNTANAQAFGIIKSGLLFQTMPEVSTSVTVHFAVIALFMLYFPFTHMTHMYTKYFMYHSVRWDDEALTAGSAREKKIQAALNYPVSWAAPHIKGDGKKTWVDVATADINKMDGGKNG